MNSKLYTNPVFQPFDEEDGDYGSSNSSPASPRDSLFSHVEVESYDTIVMLVMLKKVFNIEQEFANMKATLERLSKESVEKDAQIKHQNKHITDLTKKLEKQSSRAFNKGLSNEDSDKEYNHQRI